ncbi:MAG TPA: site-2 protease family protein [Armatimonadota bacterium]|jgi:Zn-dependent protease
MVWDLLREPHFSWVWLLGILVSFAVVVIAITVHEFAHALSARSYGDDTATAHGRLSLNPLSHYDPVGSTLFLLFGWGWARPVPINTHRMRNPRLDGIRCALWGPFSNILMATAAGLLLRFVPSMPAAAAAVLATVVYLNLWLAFFNLIPFPPLDGSRIVTNLLPDETAMRWERFAQRYGFLILLGLSFMFPGVLSTIVGIPVFMGSWAVTGMPPSDFMALIAFFR